MDIRAECQPQERPYRSMMPRLRVYLLGLFGHITSVSLWKRLITDLMLAKFPVVLGQGIALLSRHVLAEALIKSREKVDLKANERIEIAL